MNALAGKVAIVTGGSKGIGKAIARAFAREGARVTISARKPEALERAALELGPDVGWYAANAGSPAEISACVCTTMERHGSIDILVNNAATSPHQGPLVDIDLPRYDKTFQVNVRGPLVWVQECWNTHMAEHGGVVINISSIGGAKHGSANGAYGMTKAGLNYLTKHLAVELGPKVRVNAISPGFVPTDMASTVWRADSDTPLPPLGRFGTPDDIAGAAVFLASDASSWITGNVLNVDGGALIYDAHRGPNVPKPSAWTPLVGSAPNRTPTELATGMDIDG